MSVTLDALGILKVQVKRLAAALDKRRKVTDHHGRRRRTFQSIYNRGIWGKDDAPFFSCIGSNGPAADFYVERMAALLESHAQELRRTLRVVDLGCGDFRIGKALLGRVADIQYTGCDIVPELVAHNAATYTSDRVMFKTLDAVCDPLPEADVCLVRQVFQHLSNADIQAVVRQMKYPTVYVTEGHPIRRIGPVNPDKVIGASVRFDWKTGQGRGVELNQTPYNLVSEEVFRFAVPPNEVLITERLNMAKVARRSASAV